MIGGIRRAGPFARRGALLALLAAPLAAVAACGDASPAGPEDASSPDAAIVVDAGSPDTTAAYDANDASADVDAAPSIWPSSGFAGTWVVATGSGTQSCQYAPPSPNPALPAMTFTIAQTGTSSLEVTTTPTSSSQVASYGATFGLAIDGQTALGFVPACWQEAPCQDFQLTLDPSYGWGYAESLDAGADGGAGLERVPLALDLLVNQSTTSSSYGDCTTVWRYVLTRQDCQGGACGACTAGFARCDGAASDSLQTCGDAGAWGSPAVCASQFCANGACAGVCPPGGTRCDDAGVETCDPTGEWGAAAACAQQACVDGGCVGICAPATTPVCNGSQAQTCDSNGQWQGSCAQPTPDCDAGVCTCLETSCPTGCVDLSTDLQNCGTCGSACAGTCALGRCLALFAADPLPLGIATDGTTLYWTSNGTEGNNGAIFKAPLTSAGGFAETVLAPLDDPGPLTVSGGTVFFGTFDALQSVSTAGANGTILEEGVLPTSIVVSGTTVYLAAWVAGPVYDLPVGTSSTNPPPAFESVDGGAIAVAVDSNNVYAAGAAIMQLPLDGGAPVTLAQTSGMAISVANGSVYWAGASEIQSAPIGGGAVTTLAAGQSSPVAIAIDEGNVYWTNTGGGGSVMKVAIDGGAPIMLASSPVAFPPIVIGSVAASPGSLVVAGSSVYWPGTSGIMKLTPK